MRPRVLESEQDSKRAEPGEMMQWMKTFALVKYPDFIPTPTW